MNTSMMNLYAGCTHSSSLASSRHGDSQQCQEHDVGDNVFQETHDGRVPRPVQGCVWKDEVEGVNKGQGKDARHKM